MSNARLAAGDETRFNLLAGFETYEELDLQSAGSRGASGFATALLAGGAAALSAATAALVKMTIVEGAGSLVGNGLPPSEEFEISP